MLINEPESPCVRICQLDPSTKLCMGCYRTVEEIAGWSRYSTEEKLAVLEKLAVRQNAGFNSF